jgi:hypothetical protein
MYVLIQLASCARHWRWEVLHVTHQGLLQAAHWVAAVAKVLPYCAMATGQQYHSLALQMPDDGSPAAQPAGPIVILPPQALTPWRSAAGLCPLQALPVVMQAAVVRDMVAAFLTVPLPPCLLYALLFDA